jgi:DNA-binding transcriptional ArsR family regulator
MSNQAAEAVFDSLGEPVRRRIVELLASGPMAVGKMADQLPVGRPAVSKHLKSLSEAGLIQRRQDGTRNLYSLAPEGFTMAQRWLTQAWDRVLDAYAQAVSEAASTKTSDHDRRRP